MDLNYSYFITKTQGRDCVIITDNSNKGSFMTVTNAIDKIVEKIQKEEGIDANEHLIIYKDTEDIWDGYDFKTNTIFFLDADNWHEAILIYINKLLLKEKYKL